MTKYKLIKSYPGYNDLGMIAEETKGGGIEFTRSDGSQYTHSSSGEKLFESRIKPYPEYWKLIEEKYQILSFINSDNTIFKIQPSGLFKDESVGWDYGFEEGWRTLNHILTKATDCKIHSVKRPSDNVIFTVGDYVRDYPKPTKIIKFTIDKSWGGELRVGYKNGGNAITAVSKVSPPLFTTEDGVDIFDGDTAYAVGLRSGFEYNSIFEVNKKYSFDSGYYKWFSTKEKAEDYIQMDKPCLSINDIINTCKAYITPDLEASLKRIVKQKLNK